MTDELWTLEQLPERVAALLGDGYGGQANGRVRELPNGRAIRWYTTIGLVDRPAGSRGRVALYGWRHVLQLAAIKRLQAQGKSLAEIQEALLGASDEQLVDVAKPADSAEPSKPAESAESAESAASVPETTAGEAAETTPKKTRPFWRQAPAAADTVTQVVHGIRIGDSVTVVLDGAGRVPDDAELAELTAAAAPLLAAIDRLGLSSRKERR
jgi:DNA-binding transcriptional MerR regulator